MKLFFNAIVVPDGFFPLTVLAACILAIVSFSVAAETKEEKAKRSALVIGNCAYENAGALKKSAADAEDIAAVLNHYGFEVTLIKDASSQEFGSALSEFSESSCYADIALFYFSGYGAQYEKENYLFPVDVSPKEPREMRENSIQAGTVVKILSESGARASVIILDASRKNPFVRRWGNSKDQGLAPMKAPTGTIVCFAADAGEEIEDDAKGRNSLYAKHLLDNLRNPDLELRDIVMNTCLAVLKASKMNQTPALYGRISGDCFLSHSTEASVLEEEPVLMAVPTPPPTPLSLVGHLQINVNAPQASVQIDGREIGDARWDKPLEVKNLPSGKVRIRVDAEGFESEERKVDVGQGIWSQEAFILARKGDSAGEHDDSSPDKEAPPNTSDGEASFQEANDSLVAKDLKEAIERNGLTSIDILLSPEADLNKIGTRSISADFSATVKTALHVLQTLDKVIDLEKELRNFPASEDADSENLDAPKTQNRDIDTLRTRPLPDGQYNKADYAYEYSNKSQGSSGDINKWMDTPLPIINISPNQIKDTVNYEYRPGGGLLKVNVYKW